MIGIIGGGPAGGYLATQLTKSGLNVELFEEHDTIGSPVQCTGIVTPKIKKYFSLNSEFLLNKLKYACIHSPNDHILELKTNDLVLDREKFDQYIIRQAKDNGAKVYTKKKATSIAGNTILFSSKEKKEFTHIIGADGPRSIVFPIINPSLKRQYLIGIQVTVKARFNPDIYDVYLGNPCSDFFGWCVPENDGYARIGLATVSNPAQKLSLFLKKLNIDSLSILKKQGGLIPIYNPKSQIQKKNIYLVGDSALQVKATTGGGIVQGLEAAKLLSDSIIFGRPYKISKLNSELYLHKKMRSILNKFSDQDYNHLIAKLNNSQIKFILSKKSRDSPINLMFSLILNKPSLLTFARKLFDIFN